MAFSYCTLLERESSQRSAQPHTGGGPRGRNVSRQFVEDNDNEDDEEDHDGLGHETVVFDDKEKIDDGRRRRSIVGDAGVYIRVNGEFVKILSAYSNISSQRGRFCFIARDTYA